MQCTLSGWVSLNISVDLKSLQFQNKIFLMCRYFGQNCNQICKCKNFARCRKNDGYCICNDGWMGAHCEDVCPEGLLNIFTSMQNIDIFHFSYIRFSSGFYGKHCMEFCSCPSPQFVCHAAHGCVCRVGFRGTDCLTPKGLIQEPPSGNLASHKIHFLLESELIVDFSIQVKAVLALHGV